MSKKGNEISSLLDFCSALFTFVDVLVYDLFAIGGCSSKEPDDDGCFLFSSFEP